MQNDFIDMLEPTPILNTKKCKLISFIIRIFLQYFIYFVTFVSWYVYDFFTAILSLVLSFIVVGIVRSKLRNSVIPVNQREYNYTDKAIADWYTAKDLCIEINNN